MTPTLIAEAPTTDGVIATLRREDLRGHRVGLTLYAEPNPVLVKFLEDSGATADTVMPYVYAPAADADRVLQLIEQLNRKEIDAIVFTSSPQVDRLYEVAAERGQSEALRTGLTKTRVAAVGPVVADNLRGRSLAESCSSAGDGP